MKEGQWLPSAARKSSDDVSLLVIPSDPKQSARSFRKSISHAHVACPDSEERFRATSVRDEKSFSESGESTIIRIETPRVIIHPRREDVRVSIETLASRFLSSASDRTPSSFDLRRERGFEVGTTLPLTDANEPDARILTRRALISSSVSLIPFTSRLTRRTCPARGIFDRSSLADRRSRNARISGEIELREKVSPQSFPHGLACPARTSAASGLRRTRRHRRHRRVT